jgi:PTH1 family peptidyl-tRNA hydrolase
MDASEAKFIVGLGNPGRRYRHTRHNLGAMAVERLAELWNAGSARHAFDGLLWDVRHAGRTVYLLEPMTFMNRSGGSVGALMRFYRADVDDVLVVLDDLALPPGKIRIRPDGSAGGHNGLQDILTVLGTQAVPRLRLGIGPSPAEIDSADYVLGKMSDDERALASEAIDKAVAAIEDWLAGGVEEAMNRHN